MNLASITVTGSKGDEYIISLHPVTGKATCTCPGFKYHKPHSCKHLKFASAVFAGSIAGARLDPVEDIPGLWRNEKTAS